jgi:hypothetical protein
VLAGPSMAHISESLGLLTGGGVVRWDWSFGCGTSDVD